MAKRHVVKYFLELESSFVEMQDTVNELQQLAQEGKVEESSFLDAKKDLDVIKSNYERIAYIIFLLNRPNRKEDEKRELAENKRWYSYLKTSSKEAVLDESKDALKHFKEYVNSLKEN